MAERLDEDCTNENDSTNDNRQDAIVPKVEQICPLHSKNCLEVFCTTCRVSICHECALWGKHQGHRFTPLNEQSMNADSEQQRVGDVLDDTISHSTKESTLLHLDGCARRVTEALEQVQGMIDRVQAEWNTIEAEASQAVYDMFSRLRESAAAELQVLEDTKVRLETQAQEITDISEDIRTKTLRSETREMAQLMKLQIEPIPNTGGNLVSEIVPPYVSVTLRIQNFQELRTCNLKVYSRPLRLDGMVWRLRVYPNGYGEGRGKYLSVFAELTSGNGTAINYQYCIEILHCGKTVHYRQYVSDFSDGGSWGYTKFYLLSKLEEEGIISDDTLVLKFGVRAPTYHLKCSQLALHNQKLEGQLKSLKRRLRTMQQSLILYKTEGLLDDEENKCPTIAACAQPMPRKHSTSFCPMSPLYPRVAAIPEHSPCPGDGASDETRSKQVAGQNQMEIVVTTNKTDVPGCQGNSNQVVLQLNLHLDPEMTIAIKKPEDKFLQQESGAEAVGTARNWTPLSSMASFSWPASRHHSLERSRPPRLVSLERSCSMPTSSMRPQLRDETLPPQVRGEETIVEIPDCFDLTKPLVGYVPKRGVGSVTLNRSSLSPTHEGSTSPDCFTTVDHNSRHPLHTVAGTVWSCGDDVLPVTSPCKSVNGAELPTHPPSPHSQSAHVPATSAILRSPKPDFTVIEHYPEPEAYQKKPTMGDSHHLPPRPISLSPPCTDQHEADGSWLLPPPEEWGGGGPT